MFFVTVLNVFLYYIYITIYIYMYICAFAFCCLVISLVCDITSYVMNVHLELYVQQLVRANDSCFWQDL